MNYLGASGYMDLTRRAMDATTRLIAGVRAIPGLQVLGEPVMSCFAIGRVEDDADAPDLYVLAERMHARGWRLDKQQAPVSLHLTVSPAHDAVANTFLADLEACARELRGSHEQPEGAAAMYGMLGSLPDRGVVREALLDFMDGMDAT
jgi:glutamate/tyrosine decarboxylase-like PLP-dependent enzyme